MVSPSSHPFTRKLTERLRQCEAEIGDRILRISTLGLDAGARPERAARYGDAYWYQSKNYFQNWLLLHHLHLSGSDVLFDVGCGAGRLLCLAAVLFSCRLCVGVELSSSLCDLARRNAGSLRFRRSEIEIHEEDAVFMDYTLGTAFVFCNPFGRDTMAAVLERIHASVITHPRRISMVYIHPRPEHRALLAAASWLRLTTEKHFLGDGEVPVYFYEHEPLR